MWKNIPIFSITINRRGIIVPQLSVTGTDLTINSAYSRKETRKVINFIITLCAETNNSNNSNRKKPVYRELGSRYSCAERSKSKRNQRGELVLNNLLSSFSVPASKAWLNSSSFLH